MKIVVPKEQLGEPRVALLPALAEKFLKLGGISLEIESGLGQQLQISDDSYQKLGVSINPNRASMLSSADIVLRVGKPTAEDIAAMKKGCIQISFLDPFHEKDLVGKLLEKGITAVSMELMPRTTIAQKMDALSSQANLAGYAAVILAAERLKKVFPMMTTPAGTIAPVKVFVIGVGVAGLQAIATAKRLGAVVEAFDTRPTVEEQVKSLGAKFLKIDLGETGQTKDGYAKQLTPEQLEKQEKEMARVCMQSDIVITTAQVFGKKAPLLIKKETIEKMKPGSILVDMAVQSGGNVECSKPNAVIEVNGVSIVGFANLPGKVAEHASQMYSSNLYHFLSHFWDKKASTFNLNLQDELLKCVVTHNHTLHNELIKNFYQKG
ncbi:MAG TPA: Re/Si-specific NAD(P)(+) transhydrogenase subunit alpha [Chlamydiales bacterium]|nr:Re/Si-specific NAD(P)(+) transhydrogenase subunit alpha [Chlamydiales bacterium]